MPVNPVHRNRIVETAYFLAGFPVVCCIFPPGFFSFTRCSNDEPGGQASSPSESIGSLCTTWLLLDPFILCAWILFHFNFLGLRSRKAEEIRWNSFSVSLHTEPVSTRFVFEMRCRGPDGFPLEIYLAFFVFPWHFVSRMFTRGGEILFPGPKEFWMLLFSPSNTYICILWLFQTIVLSTDLETTGEMV